MKGSARHREAMMLSLLVAGMLICSASCFSPSVLPRALPRRPTSPLSLSHLEAAAEGVDRRGALRFMAVPFFMPREAWAASPFNRYTDECEVDACINRDKRVFTRAGKKFTLRQEFDKKGSKSTVRDDDDDDDDDDDKGPVPTPFLPPDMMSTDACSAGERCMGGRHCHDPLHGK
jgi:hypothetical protein